MREEALGRSSATLWTWVEPTLSSPRAHRTGSSLVVAVVIGECPSQLLLMGLGWELKAERGSAGSRELEADGFLSLGLRLLICE